MSRTRILRIVGVFVVGGAVVLATLLRPAKPPRAVAPEPPLEVAEDADDPAVE